MNRGRLIFDALYPTLLMWAVLVTIAVALHGNVPHGRDNWAQFIVLLLVIEFLVVKALLMARRMAEWAWLTVSLIAANLTFALVYMTVATRTLWPHWYAEHTETIRWSSYISLSLILVWGIWEIVNVPPPAPLDREPS